MEPTQTDNAGAGSSGAASSSATAVQNDGSEGGGEGATSSNVNSQRKRKRKTKAELKKEGVCPVCQDDIFSNKEGNVFEDRIQQQNGKLQIGARTVKILKCCGNAIHYSCFIQHKSTSGRTKCPACGVNWRSLKDEDRVRDPEDVEIKSTEETVTVDTVVYRLSCQLKF